MKRSMWSRWARGSLACRRGSGRRERFRSFRVATDAIRTRSFAGWRARDLRCNLDFFERGKLRRKGSAWKMPDSSSRSTYWFSLATAFCTLLLLIAGALVTSNNAGLSVPDWPLSYGSFFPPMVGGIFYEHGHRVIATAIGILTIILAVLISRHEPRRWVRRLGWTALALIIVQGLFGGLTVKLLLPPPVSTIHAT